MKPVSVLFVVVSAVLLAGCVSTGSERTVSAPEEAAGYNIQLGLEYLRQGRRELAMEKLNRALEQDPRSPDVHVAIAYAYNHYGERERADQHYRRALRLDSGDPGMRNTYGAFLCQHGELAEAERQFLAAARNPEYNTPAVAWTNAGICAEREPDLDKAERYYREALRIDPRHEDALWQLAQVSFDGGNALQARAFLQRYLEVSARSAESMWLGYQVEVTLGDEDAAEMYAMHLRNDFGDSEETRQLEEAERGRGR
jgi:type IV pilus assembly protein PilF